MNRGDLVLASVGVYARKPRPVAVIQDDRFSASDSVTVIPLTTHVIDAPLFRIAIEADDSSGLTARSYAMVDKLTTVRRSQVSARIGRLPSATVVELERGLLVFLGIAD